ncbi:J domain-containing protein [Clostridium sp.]|uniref:J domain-containing protein n=1 Tax=Clostridium sp. TaxID=1506 RepID=UPI003F2BD380
MDPYKILGLSPSASKDEIKSAYQNILSQLNVDKGSNVALKPEVQENLNAVNLAYDLLTDGNLYKEIRNLIEHQNFILAESKLNLIEHRNSAEWNYLQGFVQLKKGWFDTAVNHIKIATEIDPSNSEYKDSLITLQSRAQEFMNNYKQYTPPPPPPNNMNMNKANNNMAGCPGAGGGGGGGGMC